MKFNPEDFSNLDAQNIGNWPIAAKVVLIIVLIALALGAGYYFDTQHQIVAEEQAKQKENDLRSSFQIKQRKASTLALLKEQLAEIESTLEDLKKRLPSEAEVDSLINEIASQVIANGLKQNLFQPGGAVTERVYVKHPIRMVFEGDYHSFGNFVSQVASLPRIVTQHDVSIRRTGDKDEFRLVMEMTAQIYRYLEEEDDS